MARDPKARFVRASDFAEALIRALQTPPEVRKEDDGAAPGFGEGTLIAGRYRLERHLGTGGMGTVWAATHTVTRRAVALKFLRGVDHEPQIRARFLREAAAASALRHPNVVEILDVFDFEERSPVIVMELLLGETLAAKLARDGQMSLSETAALLLPVVSALGTAHAQGVVHRDLKPANIFLAGTGRDIRVKVLDFGLAKLATEQPTTTGATELVTEAGQMLGTPGYMAPEQATGGYVDLRVDIWSMGVIFYECLAGIRPIEGDGVVQIMARLRSEGIIPLENLVPALPREISECVGRMLARDPTERPRDLIEVYELLGRHASVETPTFPPPTPNHFIQA